MTDSETTMDPCDDSIAEDDVSVISDTTDGTNVVTSPSTWAGLKGLMKTPQKKRESMCRPSDKGDCSPIIPSQNRTENLSGDVEPDECLSDGESVMSSSLLTVTGVLSRPRGTTPLRPSEVKKHRVTSLLSLASANPSQPINQDEAENKTFVDEPCHSFSVPTKSNVHSKPEKQQDGRQDEKASRGNYTQILDEIFGREAPQPDSRNKSEIAGNLHGLVITQVDFQGKSSISETTQERSSEDLKLNVSQKTSSASAMSSQYSELLLTEKCLKQSTHQVECDGDDRLRPEYNQPVMSGDTRRDIFALPEVTVDVTPSAEEGIPLVDLTEKICSRLPAHQHGINNVQIDENLQTQILIDTAGHEQPPSAHQQLASQLTQEDLTTNEHPVSQLTQEDLSACRHPESQLTQKNLCACRHPESQLTQKDLCACRQPESQLTQEDLSACRHPESQLTQEDLSACRHPESQLTQEDLSACRHPESQLTQEDLSAQLLDFIIEFTQESRASSGIVQSAPSPERLLETISGQQNKCSPHEPLLNNKNSEKLLHQNQKTSSMPRSVANGPNSETIGKHSQNTHLFARSKNGKKKSTKFCPPTLSQKDVMRVQSQCVPLSLRHGCEPAKAETCPRSSSKSPQGLQNKKSDEVQLAANTPVDFHKKTATVTEGAKTWTGAANERDIMLNLMARYQAMETALQNIPVDMSTELTEIQGTVAQLNEQHKTERGMLSVRVGLKGLSKASKKQLKKELQGLGDRQKHLLQVVRRHKEVNSRLKQVLAGFTTTRTTCAGREASEETQGGMGSIAVSNLAAVGSNMQGGVHDTPGRSQIIGEPTGVSRMEGGKCDNVQTSLNYTSAKNGIVSESSFQKDHAPKEFLRDQNAWIGHTGARTYDAIEAQTSNVTDNIERKKESSGNNLYVVNQKYRDDNICDKSMEHIHISKSIPTGVEDDSVITATGNELLVKGDVRRAPCSQVKETEACACCVRSDHRNSAGEASQISGIEDSQQDLFSQGSSDQDMDRRMVEEIIATQTLSQESDCPVLGDIRHGGGGVSLGKHGEVSGREGADQGGLNKGKMEEDVTDRLVKGRMDREVDGRINTQVGKLNSQVDERMDGQADGWMDRGVAGRIDTQVAGKMDRQVDERIDGQADGWMNRGVDGRIDTQVDGKIDRQVDERIDGQADGWMDRGVDGRINTQVAGKKDRPMDRNTGGQGGVSGDRQNDVNLDRKTGVDVGETNSSETSSGPVNQHMDSKISNSVGSKTGEKANVSVEVEKDSTEKPVCVFDDNAEFDNSGDGLGRKTMKRKSEESITLGYVGPSEGEAKKIKMGRCTTGEMVGSVGTVCQSRSDVSNTQVMGVSIPHLEVQSSGSRDSEGETDESKVASDRKTAFVLPGKQTLCNQVKGSLIPMRVKSKERQHEIVKENRNCNSNNTAETTYGKSLSNHCDKGIMSATVGDVGSLPSVIASLKVSTVAPGQKEVMGLSPQERGTEKEKDMSLISPPHPHPMKNITTPPQKLPADNLRASAVLSPGSTVASSDVFPVSCRELVRRMVERDAREKQSRKDNGLLQKEAPSDYIAIPVGRIEDFSENLQLKDVAEKTNRTLNTQTHTFVQPQVPPAPRPVATSKMADLTTLVENGVLTPGKGVLSVRAQGKVFRGSLSSTGHIIGSGGEVFRTPKSWCQAVTGAVTVKKLQSYNMVLYKGHPLSSFVVPVESTESSGHKEIRTQTDCYGKPVVSSITRSLMTTDKSTSLPRQSSVVLSTTIAANKVRTRPFTHSFTKSLAKRTGTTHLKTSPAANRQTGITLPVPLPVTQTNKSSVANGEEMVAKGNKETSASMSELLKVLWRCTIKLIDDAEIVHCPEMDSTFWMTNFKDIRLSDSLWDSVDSWK